MKRISLSILIATLIFSLGIGPVYAATAIVATSTALGTGDITITATSLARQTTTIAFTTSKDVYLAATGSTATASENYTVSGGHKSGDKEYAIASSGGGVYWIGKTAGSTTLTGAPVIDATGSVTWTGYSAM
ncbi:MAG: hypothetical protein HY279_07265 [Nitrospinae bacterium]|nr:hypothetical protein [Nitrospinota bacterium]